MRIIGVFIFALIAVSGIVGSIDTKDRVTLSQHLLKKILQVRKMIQDDNIADQYDASITGLICDAHGEDEAYKSAREGFHAYLQCISPLVERINTAVGNSSIQSSDIEATNVLANVACPMRLDAKHCLDNVIEALRLCLQPKGYERIMSIFNVSVPLFELVCKDGGKWLTDFSTSDGTNCLVSKIDGVRDCVLADRNGTVEGNTTNETISTSRSLEVQWFNQFIYVHDYAELENFQECVVTGLSECENPMPSTLLNAMFNVVKDAVSRINSIQIQPDTSESDKATNNEE